MSVDVQLRGTLLYRDIENPKKTSIIEAVASLFRNKDYSVVLLTVDGKRGNHWITRAVTDEMINPDFNSEDKLNFKKPKLSIKDLADLIINE